VLGDEVLVDPLSSKTNCTLGLNRVAKLVAIAAAGGDAERMSAAADPPSILAGFLKIDARRPRGGAIEPRPGVQNGRF
jgi:hypothetical protein